MSVVDRTSMRAPAAVAPRGEALVIWVLWATYGAFYFGRTNIAAAVPGMEESVARGGLGLSPSETGLILGALKVAYGIGQLVNGQLAERVSPRRLLGVGMLCSAALNVAFGFGTGFYFLLFVWACNGYCQALGWTPCLRVTVNWFPAERRGRLIGILGTSYQLAAALTYVVSGWSAEWLGWRGAFFVPAALLAAAGLHMLLFLRETPDGEAQAQPAPALAAIGDEPRATWTTNLWLTLGNRRLWFLAVSLALLDACRYGYQDWGLKHLVEVQGSITNVEGVQDEQLTQAKEDPKQEKTKKGVGVAALKFMVLPLGGILGALVAGWATDRFFGGRRAPVICCLLVLLGVLTLFYDAVARHSLIGTVILLVVIGFAIFGPPVLLVGTAPPDLARRGTAAAAAGFVNFMGYMGAFAGDFVTGRLLEHYDWTITVRVWAAWAFGAALAASFLWNASATKRIAPGAGAAKEDNA